MILVDTSVWIDHIRNSVPALTQMLANQEVLCHPFVIGELAMGNHQRRSAFILQVRSLPSAQTALDADVHRFVNAQALHGRGIGFIDAHLLASVKLTPRANLWTRDKRVASAAVALGLAAPGLT